MPASIFTLKSHSIIVLRVPVDSSTERGGIVLLRMYHVAPNETIMFY